MFRLALAHYRMTNYSSSVAVLEKLLLAKGADRYELLGRYWLVRALQATQNARAGDEAQALIDKYPLSYYGLRLRAEKHNGVLEPWPLWSVDKADRADKADKSISGVITWTSYQKPIWDRALELGKSGWISEALAELSELTFGSKPETKTLLADQLYESGLYSMALRLTMDVVDQSPDLRCLEIISLALPDAYDQWIQTQGRKYNLSPLLVRSLIRQESAFNEKATSTSKAMGLMQLIPPTAAEVALDLGLQGLELPQDSYLPAVNVQMGTYYIARMVRQFGGNVPMGLAAYNAGPSRVSLFVKARPEIQELTGRMSSEPIDEIWFDELPWNETSFYVKAILRNTILYRLKSGERVTLGPVLWSDLRLVP
jgi:soluble lytic murein transglycosylase